MFVCCSKPKNKVPKQKQQQYKESHNFSWIITDEVNEDEQINDRHTPRIIPTLRKQSQDSPRSPVSLVHLQRTNDQSTGRPITQNVIGQTFSRSPFQRFKSPQTFIAHKNQWTMFIMNASVMKIQNPTNEIKLYLDEIPDDDDDDSQ